MHSYFFRKQGQGTSKLGTAYQPYRDERIGVIELDRKCESSITVQEVYQAGCNGGVHMLCQCPDTSKTKHLCSESGRTSENRCILHHRLAFVDV